MWRETPNRQQKQPEDCSRPSPTHVAGVTWEAAREPRAQTASLRGGVGASDCSTPKCGSVCSERKVTHPASAQRTAT